MKAVAALLLAVALPLAAPVRAAETDAEFGRKVREYLLANPEVIEEAIGALQQKKDTERVAMQQDVLKGAQRELYDAPANVVLGNPKGSVTIVEFFDYNCGYCKRAFPDMVALLGSNPDLRFILKEFPVLGDGSREAALVAAALHRVAPMRYQDFHKRLITVRGEVNKAKAMEMATAAGVDAAAIEAELKKPEAAASVDATLKLADGLGINGTPSYIVAGEVVPGAIGADRLQQRIAAARK
jgi:protein-disulfide isomerase